MTRILTIALAAIFTMSVNANAEKPAGEKGAGKPGQRGDRAGQRAGGPQGAGRSPEQMVTQMMSEFDKDGDQKLDVAELTALFTSMRESGVPKVLPDVAGKQARKAPHAAGPVLQGRVTPHDNHARQDKVVVAGNPEPSKKKLAVSDPSDRIPSDR